MGTNELKRIRNVKQFVHVDREISGALMRHGHVFNNSIPAFLRPHIRNLGPWPGRNDQLFPFSSLDNQGRAISGEDKARHGTFETKGIVAKPGFEIAGHTYRIGPDDFEYGPLSPEVAREKIQRPMLEWNKAIALGLLNLVTAGAYDSSTDARTAGYAWQHKDFEGNTVEIGKVTESASEASPTIANSGHSIKWADKQGGEFAAGHDHLPANAGGAWTESLGKTARDHIMEHPGVTGVRAYVGKNVVDDIESVMETAYGSTESGVEFEKGGAMEAEFGVPAFIGRHDNVDYYRVDCLPDDLGVYAAVNRKPVGLSMGKKLANGETRLPGAWSGEVDPETKEVDYGFRGTAVAHVLEPTAFYVTRYTV